MSISTSKVSKVKHDKLLSALCEGEDGFRYRSVCLYHVHAPCGFEINYTSYCWPLTTNGFATKVPIKPILHPNKRATDQVEKWTTAQMEAGLQDKTTKDHNTQIRLSGHILISDSLYCNLIWKPSSLAINRHWISSHSGASAEENMWWKTKKMPRHFLASIEAIFLKQLLHSKVEERSTPGTRSTRLRLNISEPERLQICIK